MSHFRQFVLLAIVGLMLVGWPFLAWADIGVAPANPKESEPLSKSWFVYTSTPGSTIEDAMIVSNHAEELVTVRVYPIEAMVDERGSFIPREETQFEDEISAWVTVEKNEIKLGPGESQTIPFRLRVPSNVQGGIYYGALVAEAVAEESPKPGEPSAKDTQAFGFQITGRVGTRIYLTVQGGEAGLNVWYIAIPIIVVGVGLFAYYYFQKTKKIPAKRP